MQTHIPAPFDQAKQPQNNSLQQPAQLVGGQQGEFVDDRQEIAESLQLRQLMANSSQAVEGRTLQAMMNNSPQARAAQAFQRMVNSNPQLQGAAALSVQRVEEAPLQAKTASGHAAQLETTTEAPKPNNTGLPDNLKSGIESLSGMRMDHVKVHYNSSQPAQLNAHAYAQGSEIHVAPGQEQHLPHEAWHVVQQAQGRVKPTMQMKAGVQVNNDAELEVEADVMGAKALSQLITQNVSETIQREENSTLNSPTHLITNPVLQRVLIGKFDITDKSRIEDIESALGWNKNYGITTSLTQGQKLALKNELKNREDCADILEELGDSDNESLSGDDVSWDNDSEDGFTSSQPNFASLDKEEQAKARKKLADDFKWGEFPDSIDDFNKIGVHETTTKENSAALAKDGPSRKMINTGHGIGKGPGFYVTPVGKKQLSTAIGAIEYGNELLAIYIDNSVKAFQSPSGDHDNVDTLMRLAVLHSIEEHKNQLEFLIEDAHTLLNEIDVGIAINEKKLEELDLLADDIETQLVKIEKDLKQLKRKLGKVTRMIEEMRRHQAEIQHPTDLYYFIMSGGGEIVIPVESYDMVRALNSKDSLQGK